MSSLEKLFTKLDEYIYVNRYSNHRSVKLLEGGDIKKENVRQWAIYKYFQVFQQNCNFSAIHANAIYQEDIRQYQMQQLLAEETALQDGSDTHYGLMRRFAFAIGATEIELKNINPPAAIMDFFHFQYKHCMTNPIYGMLSIYLVESQTSTSAEKMYHAFKKMYNLTDYDLEWFLVHSLAEEEHAGKAKELIIKYANDYVDFELKSWDVIKTGIQKWIELQNFYSKVLVGENIYNPQPIKTFE